MTTSSSYRLFFIPVMIFIVLLFYKKLYATDITVTTTVDQNPATLEDIITLSVTVQGVRQSTSPVLPNLSGFRVHGRSTSSSVRIINGTMKASVTHNYQLIPHKPGVFSIGPVKVNVAGQVYESNALKMTINKPLSQGPEVQSLAFAKLSVSNPKPYIHEQVILTLRLYRRIDVKNINLNWSFDSFQKEDLGKGREYPEVVNGLKYLVHELQVALFGSRLGSFKIEPATVELDLILQNSRQRTGSPFDHFFNDPFFNRNRRLEHKILRSNQVKIDVQPLPEINKPTDFSNLIGQFNIQGSLGKTQLETGDTTTLTVTVSGTGNIQNAEVQAPQLGDKFKVYPDQPQLQKSASSQKVTGQKIFKFALVPLETGELTIPALSLSFFDPITRQYHIRKTHPLTLKVKPSQANNALHSIKPMPLDPTNPKIEVLGKDILPIHTRLEDFTNRDWNRSNKGLYISGLILPVFLYFGLFFLIRHQHRLHEDIAFSRARRAFKQAKLKLDRLASHSEPDSKIFARELSQTLREYIGDKLNMQGTAFTALEVEMKLKEQNYPENQVIEIKKLLEKYETFQYGLNNQRPPRELLDESFHVLKKLERQT